jgi:WD40 repeat protein
VARIYKISDNQGRTAANRDNNLVREFERMPGVVQAVAWSPDGVQVALGSVGGEARVFSAKDGKRTATLKGHAGAIFALAWHPGTNGWIYTGGFEGRVRVFDATKGELLRRFVPAPLDAADAQKQAAK